MQSNTTSLVLMLVILTVTHFNVILTSPLPSSASSSSPTTSEDKQLQNMYDTLVAESKLSPFGSEEPVKESNEVEDKPALPVANLDRIFSYVKNSRSASGSGSGTKSWMLRRAIQDRQHKRQIRYQQCYFNPISCF